MVTKWGVAVHADSVPHLTVLSIGDVGNLYKELLINDFLFFYEMPLKNDYWVVSGFILGICL